jgi:eukaryotic-like serine/threonine-protein kinase
VKVTDFGIAHAADEAPRTEAGMVVGTAAYLSPEQVACRPATPASDIYALGVVAYECLAGRRPFTGDHPIALALAHRHSAPPPLPDDVPESVRELVGWTMSKAPRARPPSAGALGRQALVTRAGLADSARSDDLDTPSSGWLPVMSGWHPALGPGQQDEDSAPPSDGLADGAPGAAANGHAKANGNGKVPPPAPDPADEDPGEQATGEWAPAAPARDRQAPDGQPTGEWTPEALAGWEGAPGRRRRAVRPWRRRGVMLAVLALLTVVVAGGLTAAARQRAVAVVPSVAGLRMAAAGEALTRAGFEVRGRSRPDASIHAGVVLAQDPAAGTRLARGRTVTMVVSSGPRAVVLDPERYLGRQIDDVRTALIRLRLRVSVSGRPAWAEPGTVTAINPSGSLHQGDNVTVTIATLEPPTTVTAAPNTGVGRAAGGEHSGENGDRKGKHKDGDKGGGNGGGHGD